MACRLFGDNPLSKTMLPYCQLDHVERISVAFFFQNSKVNVIRWNALENVVCETVAIYFGLNVLAAYSIMVEYMVALWNKMYVMLKEWHCQL